MRTRLITNGLDWHRLSKASQSKVDAVHIELEDGIPSNRKQEAREMIVRCLRELDWGGKFTMVRTNHYKSGLLEDDILEVSKGRPSAFLLGKCEGPDEVRYVDRLLGWVERRNGISAGSISLVVDVETLTALKAIEEVVIASPRMKGLTLGLSDLGNEYGYRRSFRGLELETLYPRSRVVMAAHLAGLVAFAPPFLYYRDLEGTYEYCRWAYNMGFDAGTCISPNQIETVARAFSPSEEEISWAQGVLEGERKAEGGEIAAWTGPGLGAGAADPAAVVMMDAPHANRARKIIEQARRAGLVK